MAINRTQIEHARDLLRQAKNPSQRQFSPHDRLDWLTEVTEIMFNELVEYLETQPRLAWRMTKKHEQWLKQGAEHAARILQEQPTYASANEGLMFYYARKVIVLHGGNAYEAGQVVGVDDAVLKSRIREVQSRGMKLSPTAQQECETWATLLAMEGATYREAVFIFTRSLMEVAIEQAGGNRCEAARRLKVHRNTAWRIPDKPGRPSFPRRGAA